MQNGRTLEATEKFLREKIPLTAAMDLRVVEAPGDGFAVEAPVSRNHNHLGTAFGGSINAVATLAGYALLWLELGESAQLVIRASSIRFLRPVCATIRARCAPPGRAQLEAFREELARKGRARIALRVRVEENQELAAEFEATFVATTKARGES